MMSDCQVFNSNPMKPILCRTCFRVKDEHPPEDPYGLEKQYRQYIEDILYDGVSEADFKQADIYTAKLLQNLPPPEEYFKIFNVYSFVRHNLSNPKLKDLSSEDKMLAIYMTIDFLLTIVLPLRRPPRFEEFSKLRRKIPKMIEAEKLEGTQDVIVKLGYSRITDDHFEFPPEVTKPPDQVMIREFTADLKIALEEVKCYHYHQHKFPERFLETFEWAKRTTPFVPENELKALDGKISDLLGSRHSSITNESPHRAYGRSKSGLSRFPPTTNPQPIPAQAFDHTIAPQPMQQPPYGPYDPSGQKDPLYSIAPTVPPQQYYQPMTPKEDYPPELNRPNVIPEPEEPINIPDDMTMCPVPSCRTLNLKKSFACKKCRMGLQGPSLDIVNPEVSIIPGIIPVEKWNCSACSYENTTAQGRPRICEICTTNNSMPAPDVSPQPPSQHYDPTQDKGRLYNSTKDKNPLYEQDQTEYHESSNYPEVPRFPDPSSNYPGVPRYPEPNPSTPRYPFPQRFPPTNPPFRNPIPEQMDPNLPYPPQHMYPPQPPPPDNLPYKKIKHLISETHLTYKDEVLQLALEKCGITNAVHWLSTQFNNNITMLAENVRNHEFCDNATTKEVEDSYIECRGDMTQVAPRIQQARSRKLEELMKALNIKREMAVVELGKNNWEVVGALDNIILLNNQKYLEECRPRIWAGSKTVPEVPVDHFDEELWDQVELLAENPQEIDSKMTRKFLCELKIPTLTQLNLLLQLAISEDTKDREPKDLLQAVKEVSDYDGALRFLNQECEICIENYTANDMIQMFLCPHSVCKECYRGHFTNAVRNSAIKNWTCPVCSEPDIQQMEDPYYYFGLLSIVIQELCEGEVVKLFHQKVNEFAICKKPEFRWCPHCNCGFMGRDDMIKLACPQPECQKIMCYRCKRKWEDEHEGRTCEEFQQWREENDRDILDKGLAAKLVEEGVECPCCKFKYELVRGGCMHFRCSQCPAEFCSGCFQLFKKDNCKKFNSCANKGLHAHHPRNCMYHTRDMDVAKMKELLEKGGFQRDEAVQEQPPPQPAQPDEGAQPNPPKKRRAKIYKARVPEQHLNAVIDELKTKEKEDYKERPQGELQIPCQIVEFRDNPDGGFDKDNCVRFSLEKDGYAGLCEKHYKEYLCGLITNDGLDPIDVLEVTEDSIFELWAVLKRNEIPFNEKTMKGDELKQLIKEKLPLQPMTVAGALQA